MKSSLESRLSQHQIRSYKTDIRTWSAAKLVDEFGSARSGRIVVARLARNLAYQAFCDIRDGKEPPVEGNVRTFWYRWVKPALLRVSSRRRRIKDADVAAGRALADLIERERLFDYEDFGFNDENWRNRAIGLRRPTVLMFAEKVAHVRLLARMHHRLGASFVALGGQPSACTSEYTAKQVIASLPPTTDGDVPQVHLVGLVDHDPSGAIIARAFADQLRSFGLAAASTTLVVRPDVFTDAQLELARLPLEDVRFVADWMAGGGGVDGQPFALSVEALPAQRIEALLTEAVTKLAPDALPVTGVAGVDVGDYDPRETLVVRMQDVGPSTMAEAVAGKRVLVVDRGKVVLAFGGQQAR